MRHLPNQASKLGALVMHSIYSESRNNGHLSFRWESTPQRIMPNQSRTNRSTPTHLEYRFIHAFVGITLSHSLSNSLTASWLFIAGFVYPVRDVGVRRLEFDKPSHDWTLTTVTNSFISVIEPNQIARSALCHKTNALAIIMNQIRFFGMKQHWQSGGLKD